MPTIPHTFTVRAPGAALPVQTVREVEHEHRPNRYVAALALEEALEYLVADYGHDAEVLRITAGGQTLFSSERVGFRPLPLRLSQRMRESFPHPYDAFIDLCQDEHDGLGGADYLAWLLEG